MEAPWPQMFLADHHRVFEPTVERGASALSKFEPYRLLGLALKYGGSLLDLTGCVNIRDLEADEVATSKLAVDRSVEQREVANVLSDLETHAYGPNVFGLQRSFLANDPALIPGGLLWANGEQIGNVHD